jgi:adenylylsulfate kinase
MNPSEEIVWHQHSVTRADREQLLGQRGCVIWLTGLSGCGKSTIANALDNLLRQQGVATFLLDGDNVRHGLCAGPERLLGKHSAEFAKRFGLGFSPEDREENIRRIGCVAELMAAAGLITLTAFVSPYRRDRDFVRERIEGSGRAGDFLEIFVDTPLEECERRDPKGLYKKARAGEIPHFTGISDPYEAPLRPDMHCRTIGQTPLETAKEIENFLAKSGYLHLS